MEQNLENSSTFNFVTKVYTRPAQAIGLLEQVRNNLGAYLTARGVSPESMESALQKLEQTLERQLVSFDAGDFGRYRVLIFRMLSQFIDRLGQCELGSPPRMGSLAVFNVFWRDAMLNAAWDRLHMVESHRHRPYFSIYQKCVENPTLMRDELIEKAASLSIIHCPRSFRDLLRQSRRKFLLLLREQIANSLRDSSFEKVNDELSELGLNHHH